MIFCLRGKNRMSRALRPLILSVWAILLCIAPASFAEEPFERFLQKLRDEQLFDLALEYLKQQSASTDASPQFKASLQFEEGLLHYQSASRLGFSNPKRAIKLNDAENAIRRFLDQAKQHPRRGEARLKLGELLLSRAEEAKQANSGDSSQEAVQFYDDAHKLFESTIKELAGILENLKGARVDPDDQAQVAYRLKIRQDLRQAQLLSAKAVEERGRSRPDKSPQRAADLKQSLKMFSELYSKAQMVGVKNYALFYRSAIQKTLGMNDDAIDGFQRVADVASVEALRPLQAEAVTELVQLLAAEKKYQLAVDRSDKWISGILPNEREAPETMTLKLETAKVRIAWADKLKADDPDSRVASKLVRDTRTDLRSMLRIQGAHLDATRQMLTDLGIDFKSSNGDELPKVATFEEALEEAQIRIDQAEEDEEAAEQALTLLREAVRLYSKDDDRDQLFETHYRIAYLLLLRKDLWGSMAISELLARQAAGNDKGMQAARITLNAFSELLGKADEARRSQLTTHLEPFAEFMISAWPQAPESAAAGAALVQLAAMNGQWDRIDKFIDMMPDSGDAVANLRRDVGVRIYNRFTKERKAQGETPEVEKLRQQAIASLEIGTAKAPDQIDASWIDAVCVLVRSYLQANRLDDAAKLLFNGKGSPIKAIEKDSSITSAKGAMNAYRTALQVVVSQLAADKINSQDASIRTTEYLSKLKSLAGQAENGSQILEQDLVRLVSELSEQIQSLKNEQKRNSLSQSLVVIASEAAKSEDFKIQNFAARTLLTAAEDLSSSKSGAAAAKKAYAGASAVLQEVLAREARQPGWIQPESMKLQLKVLYGQALRGEGNYKQSMAELAEVLGENSGLLDAQIEAARTYQAWGDNVNSGFHELAYNGGRPDKKTKRNLVWGWGQIARAVEPHEQYRDKFFLARFELAKSRYKFAMGQKNEANKIKLLKRAAKDISDTATLYPELGGATQKSKFTALQRRIAQQLPKER